jgi:hypothetical protein
MARGRESAERTSIVPRDRVIDCVRRELRVVVTVERTMTVEQISQASGVAVRAIRSYMDNEPTEVREPPTSATLSIAVVLGKRCVNAVLSLIGYGGAEPLDEPDVVEPMTIVAEMMGDIAVIAQAAARGKTHITHCDMPAVRKAADEIVADALKLSSIAVAE